MTRGFAEPKQAPTPWLMLLPLCACVQATRDALAEALNSAILRHRGLPAVSPLERIYQQAAVVLEQLKVHNVPQALMIDLGKAVLGGAGE